MNNQQQVNPTVQNIQKIIDELKSSFGSNKNDKFKLNNIKIDDYAKHYDKVKDDTHTLKIYNEYGDKIYNELLNDKYNLDNSNDKIKQLKENLIKLQAISLLSKDNIDKEKDNFKILIHNSIININQELVDNLSLEFNDNQNGGYKKYLKYNS
jgi:hypothetical protein